MNNNKDLLEKAKNYAFLLLKFRPLSEKELYQRLKKKRFDDSIIKETISFLKATHLINDAYFAKIWIESRLKKPFGLRRIRQELELKGIDREIVDCEIMEIKKSYAEQDIVRRIAQERISKLKGVDSEKRKQRIFFYLLRRGFSPDVVKDTINRL